MLVWTTTSLLAARRWRLSSLEEEDGLLADVEVDESNLVGDVGSELGADDGVPRGAVFVVESLLDGESDVLLQLMGTDGLFADGDGVSFEGVWHVAGLDPALELDGEGDGRGLRGGGGLGGGSLGGRRLSGGCLCGGGFGGCFVGHGSSLDEIRDQGENDWSSGPLF